jgi:molybdopterin molybdotransferase
MRFHRQTITVEEARNRLLARSFSLAAEEADLYQAYGRTLAKDEYATCDLPPFDRSPLDGYAVLAADTIGATMENPVYLRVVETIAAGDVPQTKVLPGTACRIMTGGMMPPGADAVIMFEQTVNPAEVSDVIGVKRALKSGENISRQGEETKAGRCIAKKGEAINAGTLALLATFGIARVSVVRKPRVGIFSTGSELVRHDQPLLPGMIRDSNTVMLHALIREAGGEPVLLDKLPDQPEAAKRVLAAYSDETDFLITTGGVSVGDFDIIADLVDDPQVELLFNRVAMRPGSPTTAAVYRGKIICALSGNPGACFLGFELFVKPLIKRLLGRQEEATVRAVLASDYEKPCPFPRYLRGKLAEQGATLYAVPDFNEKSGNLSTLKESECFIVIPAGGKGKKAGEVVEVLPHRSPSWYGRDQDENERYREQPVCDPGGRIFQQRQNHFVDRADQKAGGAQHPRGRHQA